MILWCLETTAGVICEKGAEKAPRSQEQIIK